MQRLTTIAALVLLLANGCGSSKDSGELPTDAGPYPDTVTAPDTVAVADAAPALDTVADAGSDAGSDAVTETDTVDVPDTEAAGDAVTDAGSDAGSDAVMDAGSDAGSDTDTAADTGAPPCETAMDCLLAWGDDDPCVMYDCVDGSCVSEPRSACCLTNVDCNDWDVCTRDMCDTGAHRCLNLPSEDPECCRGSWLLQEDFDDGLPESWRVERPEEARAFWEVVALTNPPGQQVLRFRDPTLDGYGTGYHESGALWAAPLTIPADEPYPIFRFDLKLDTEWRLSEEPPQENDPRVYDKLTLSLLVDGEEEEVWSSYSPDVEGATCPQGAYGDCEFGSFALLLDEYRGKSVQPVFRFDTGDHIDNDYAGPSLDNVGLELACRLPGECLSAADCDDQDPCYDDYCTDGACEHVPNYTSGCCYPYDQARWTFDPNYLAGFTVTPPSDVVGWHTSDLRSVSSPTSLRFGNRTAATYDDPGSPVAGQADSPTTTLSSYRRSVLTLQVWVDLEVFDNDAPERDRFQILLIDASDDSQFLLWDRSALAPAQHATWVPLEIDLDDFRGRVIFLRFRFSSGDDQENSGEGVYVDDIYVTRLCE